MASRYGDDITMKQKLVALLLVSAIIISALGALGAISALGALGAPTPQKTQVSSSSSNSLTLSSSAMNPQPGESFYLYGIFTHGGKPGSNAKVDIYFSRDNSPAFKWRSVVTDKNGFFRTGWVGFPVSDLGHAMTFQAKYLTFRKTWILRDGIPLTVSYFTQGSLTLGCKWRTSLSLGMLSPSNPLVAHGKKYAVKGTLTDSRGLALKQEPAKLVWAYQSNPGWKPWTTVRTDNRGAYTAVRADYQSVQLYAQFPGDVTHWGSSKMLAVRIV